MLAEYRDQNIPTSWLREAVAGPREMFDLAYPLAHLGPYLAAESGELEIDRQQVDPSYDSLAHFERDLVHERTLAGLETARARGRMGGRPSVMTAAKSRSARS